jgi:hypothetical protein
MGSPQADGPQQPVFEDEEVTAAAIAPYFS